MAVSRGAHKGVNHFERLQNRVRGVVGASRSRQFERVPREKILSARIRLSAILTEARQHLEANRYQAFLRWSDNYTKLQAPAIERARYHFDELGSLTWKHPLDLRSEIDATSSRLALACEAITGFRQLADRVEAAFWDSDELAAQEALSEIEMAFGQSLWLIEAQIAFRQLNEGLNSQKRFVQEVRAKVRRGIAGYFAFFTSVKNEPTVTLPRFAADFSSRLNRSSKLSPSAKQYLNLKLADNWPSTDNGIAAILQIEQTTSIIDLYETFVRVAQRLVSEEPGESISIALQSALSMLAGVDDYRLRKLRILLEPGLKFENWSWADPVATDLLLCGEFRKAYKTSKRLFSSNRNINDLITAALCLRERPRARLRPALTQRLLNGLAVINGKNDDFERSSSDLLRLTRNFSFLSSVKALRQVIEIESTPKLGTPNRQFTLKFLNGRQLDVRDFVNWFDVGKNPALERLLLEYSGPTASAILALHNHKADGQRSTIPSYQGRAIDIAAGLRLDSGSTATISHCVSFIDDTMMPLTVRVQLALLLIQHLIKKRETGAAVDLIAREFVRRPSLQRALPIGALLGADGWRVLRRYSNQISVPIVLDLQWRETNDDRIATYRRFATNQFLAKNGFERPSDMRARFAKFSRCELVYFLDKICVTSVLDMLPIFKSSQELDEERERICAALVELDPEHSDQYQDELLQLTKRKVLQSGLKLVDSSRVYVDGDGIARWARKELSESFFRYRNLVDAGVGVAEKLNDLIIKMYKKDALQEYFYFFLTAKPTKY